MEDLTFQRDGLDLVITQTGTENEIRVTDEYQAAQAAGEAATNRGEVNPGSKREGDQASGALPATLDEVGPA